MKFSKKIKDVLIHHFKKIPLKLSKITRLQKTNCFQLTYSYNLKQFHKNTEYLKYQKSKQINLSQTLNSNNQKLQIISNLQNRILKDDLGYFDVDKEVEILTISTFLKGDYDSKIIDFTLEKEMRKKKYVEKVQEIHSHFRISLFSQYFQKDKRITDFLVRSYYYNKNKYLRKLKKLTSYPSILNLFLIKNKYYIENTKSSLKKNFSNNTISFINKKIKNNHIYQYFFKTNESLNLLIENFYQYTRLIKQYDDEFSILLAKYIYDYPDNLLCTHQLHECLARMIHKGDYSHLYELLIEPLPTYRVLDHPNLKARELVTRNSLRKEGREMGHCIGDHGYENAVKYYNNRIFAIEVFGSRYTLQLIKNGKQYRINEVKGRFNLEVNKKSMKLINLFVLKLNQ